MDKPAFYCIELKRSLSTESLLGGWEMNIHEYQGKEILRKYGVAVPNGKVAFTVEEAVEAAKNLGTKVCVVKAQIHAGGRGKAGGVKVAKNLDEVRTYAGEILGKDIGNTSNRS